MKLTEAMKFADAMHYEDPKVRAKRQYGEYKINTIAAIKGNVTTIAQDLKKEGKLDLAKKLEEAIALLLKVERKFRAHDSLV
jgi:hypothetical protein